MSHGQGKPHNGQGNVREKSGNFVRAHGWTPWMIITWTYVITHDMAIMQLSSYQMVSQVYNALWYMLLSELQNTSSARMPIECFFFHILLMLPNCSCIWFDILFDLISCFMFWESFYKHLKLGESNSFPNILTSVAKLDKNDQSKVWLISNESATDNYFPNWYLSSCGNLCCFFTANLTWITVGVHFWCRTLYSIYHFEHQVI